MYDRDDLDVIAFLPSDSLQSQLAAWQARDPQRRWRCSTATTAAGVKRALRGARLALVDATTHCDEATDVYVHAVERLSADVVAVYSEQVHEGLEFLVRRRGSMLLFGPLADRQWDELIERLAFVAARRSCGDTTTPRQVRKPREVVIPLRTKPVRWPTGVRRPRTSA